MKSAPSKTSSSTSHEAEEGKSQAKKHGYDNDENLNATPSKKAKKGPGIDLEELLAQSYPKQPSYTPPPQRAVRRSSRSKYTPLQPLESVKKWSAHEEICVARALLETCSPSGEVKMNVFYERAQEELEKHISKSQLYDKVRSMHRRFRSIQSKLHDLNIPQESFAFKTPQEAELFQLWKQIWGNNNNHNISANGGHTPRGGNLSEAENPREIHFENKTEESDGGAEESTGDRRHQEEEEPHQTNLQEKKSPLETLADKGKKGSGCECKGLQNRMKKVVERTEERVGALIEGFCSRLQASLGGGCSFSVLSRRMKELMDAVNSAEEFPGLSGDQANELQQKWRRHRIEELKVLSECLGLLHAQCNAFLQNLDS